MADVNITIDGKKVTAPAGTLLIEVCRSLGIEVPAFCYYPGLSLQAACRMCLVEIEKIPKMQTACTVPVTDGMVVHTSTDQVRQARKSTLELLLGNHPLDCPVCDAGGECELQDMTFAYGAAESKFMEFKQHRDEQQWSPVVFFDRPRCILCYRCVRVCGEAMDVWALGVQNRGALSTIAPNEGDHLECEECGMCIDICPVGALTSGAYRYKTRPWEMTHTGTICTHCGDGCKTTLGVRRHETGMQIVRGDNRDKSGINGDFLCIKGRYAFDFTHDPRRLTQPLVRRGERLVEAPWEEALDLVASKLREVRDHGGSSIGVIGSNRTTNEENYLLQKFARVVLGTNNIDHHRTADFPALAAALKGTNVGTATMRDVFDAKTILLIGGNPTDEHPLLAYQIRNNVRLHRARLYCVNAYPIKLRRQSLGFAQVPAGTELQAITFLAGDDGVGETLGSDARNELLDMRQKLTSGPPGVLIFGSEIRGSGVRAIVRLAQKLNAKIICMADYANSRGAADMGVYPSLLPGYTNDAALYSQEWSATLPNSSGLNIEQMFASARDGNLSALYVVGSNPVVRYNVDPFALHKTFVVVHELFMTETASLANVVFPAACAYEKTGTFTNTCGDLQLLKKAGELAGTKPDFEIVVEIADRMGFDVRKLVPFGGAMTADMGQSRGAQTGEADRHAIWLAANRLEPKLSPLDPMAILDEIQRLVPGYNASRLNLRLGNDEHTTALEHGAGSTDSDPDTIVPSEDTLFTSGTLGRYSATLQSVIENQRTVPADKESLL
jgi:NADH-quinone oxidoreductase subunit G